MSARYRNSASVIVMSSCARSLAATGAVAFLSADIRSPIQLIR
jgi:hypothetical protein